MTVSDFNVKYQRCQDGMTASDLIRSWLPGCVTVERAEKKDDLNGIDYWAVLRKGARVGIDHKLREAGCKRFWKNGSPELPMEIWSVMPDTANKGVTGWTLSETKNTDYVLFTFDLSDSDQAFLLPFQLLRIAFHNNYAHWRSLYIQRPQESVRGGLRWKSEAAFVPANIVLAEINALMNKACEART